jgi:hypothetical protein
MHVVCTALLAMRALTVPAPSPLTGVFSAQPPLSCCSTSTQQQQQPQQHGCGLCKHTVQRIAYVGALACACARVCVPWGVWRCSITVQCPVSVCARCLRRLGCHSHLHAVPTNTARCCSSGGGTTAANSCGGPWGGACLQQPRRRLSYRQDTQNMPCAGVAAFAEAVLECTWLLRLRMSKIVWC